MASIRSQTVPVLESWMHYRETGSGRPVLLLHGNPTSSFLWRHVLARAGEAGSGHRWIAPDLIGMGASGKPDLAYRLRDHVAYLDAFITALGLSDVVLVGHDWGVAMALDRLARRPHDVRAVALMEGHLHPLDSWDAFDEGGRELFRRLRTAGVGEQLALEENFFIETVLPVGLTREVSDGELEVYRAPYPDAPSRRPLLQWAREIPVGGEPAEVAHLMTTAVEHLTVSPIPKLLLYAEPGVLVSAATVVWCQSRLSQLTTVDVGGPAGHFLPEDRPREVANTLVDWVTHLP